MIFGHDLIRTQLMDAIAQDKLHHAYLLDGPRGIGKAGFAETMLPHILGGQGAQGLLHSGAHPDFIRLEIEADPKTGKMRRDITRDQVEKLLQFLIKHTSLADRKVVLIDAADDLNVNAANNLLKWLEEPRPNTCLLLVAHRVDRLLPTIRSRCARLRFRPLDRSAFMQFAESQGQDQDQERDQALLSDPERLFTLSGGIPGQALQLSNPKVEQAKATLSKLINTSFDTDPLALARLARSLLVSPDIEGLNMSLRLLRHSLREQAGAADNPAQANFAAIAYKETLNKDSQAKSLNIDPAQVLATLLLDLRDLARQGQTHV